VGLGGASRRGPGRSLPAWAWAEPPGVGLGGASRRGRRREPPGARLGGASRRGRRREPPGGGSAERPGAGPGRSLLTRRVADLARAEARSGRGRFAAGVVRRRGYARVGGQSQRPCSRYRAVRPPHPRRSSAVADAQVAGRIGLVGIGERPPAAVTGLPACKPRRSRPGRCRPPGLPRDRCRASQFGRARRPPSHRRRTPPVCWAPRVPSPRRRTPPVRWLRGCQAAAVAPRRFAPLPGCRAPRSDPLVRRARAPPEGRSSCDLGRGRRSRSASALRSVAHLLRVQSGLGSLRHVEAARRGRSRRIQTKERGAGRP
jgi:hypothetical protein